MTKQEKFFMREGKRYRRLATEAERKGDLALADKMKMRAQDARTISERLGAILKAA